MAMPVDINARKFYRVALRRLEEAKVINSKLRYWAVAEYLGGYAVECILKALVITRTPIGRRTSSGATMTEWLKMEFGHNLNSLRKHLATQGVELPSEIAREFLFVSTWDPQLRYEPGPGDPHRAERFLSATAAVLKWADERM